MEVIHKLESKVRSYVRSFPTVFAKAKGSVMIDESGKEYIDFFAGAGVLNYGHNPEAMMQAIQDYISQNGIMHSLDMATEMKVRFLKKFDEIILKPRNMNYKVMFTGPTGTNSVESALKLARKYTGRTNVISFTNGFHGMTLGALAVTGNEMKRGGAGSDLHNVKSMPFDGYLGEDINTIDVIEKMIEGSSSGVDIPAAFIVETVQGEGGINVASKEWLLSLQKLAKKHNILLIIDDIQSGCGRTGTFFSFEEMGLDPDIICLSKSLSGSGQPFAVLLFRPELDVWSPGEHNGTFRGNNLAFVTASVALDYWADESFQKNLKDKVDFVQTTLRNLNESIQKKYGFKTTFKGRGFMNGISFEQAELASEIAAKAFEKGVLVETAGAKDEVLKFLHPITISKELFLKGVEFIEQAIDDVVAEKNSNKVKKIA